MKMTLSSALFTLSIVAVLVATTLVSLSVRISLSLDVDRGTTALLIIDVQNCFTSGGTLAVPDAEEVIPVINKLRVEHEFDVIVLTQDWHCPNHVSFASQHPGCRVLDVINLTYLETGELCHSDGDCIANTHANDAITDRCTPPRHNGQVRQRIVEQHLWPDHCVINTTDAQFHTKLIVKSTDVVVRKGYHCQIDSYSGFYDNGRMTSTEMHRVLSERDVKTVFVVGVATDFCVYHTAKDASSLGYKTYVVLDATRGVGTTATEAALYDMRSLGIQLISFNDVPLALSTVSSATICGKSVTSLAAILVVVWVARYWLWDASA